MINNNPQHLNKDLGFIFITDTTNSRTFLLDSGANCNLLDIDQLTPAETKDIDKNSIIRITGFNKQNPTTYSLGETNITITTPPVTAEISVHVMPSKILNYNIIGVTDIRKHFLPVLMSKCNTPPPQIVTHPAYQSTLNSDTPCAQSSSHPPSPALSHNLIYADPTPITANSKTPVTPTACPNPLTYIPDSERNITYEQASQLYAKTPMPEAKPHLPPKQLIDISWFQSLWQLFPRLAKEHENLSEPSRLPHDFSIKLKANAKPHISPTYQMDKRRTTELLLFLQKAIADNLIVATPCKYISASFMVPRSDPNKPYRCKIFTFVPKPALT